MKYLNKYKIFESDSAIEAICKNYGITNYSINNNGSIDVNGEVNLMDKRLVFLPIKFGIVTGSFICSDNNLETLYNFPQEVGGGINCSNNNLTSLKGIGKVGGQIICSFNKLTSLEGIDELDSVITLINCRYNKIKSLEFYPRLKSNYGHNFLLYGNPIYKMVKCFIEKENRDELVELFNYCDIVQDDNVILDRLIWFYEEIGITLHKYLIHEISKYYTIIK